MKYKILKKINNNIYVRFYIIDTLYYDVLIELDNGEYNYSGGILLNGIKMDQLEFKDNNNIVADIVADIVKGAL